MLRRCQRILMIMQIGCAIYSSISLNPRGQTRKKNQTDNQTDKQQLSCASAFMTCFAFTDLHRRSQTRSALRRFRLFIFFVSSHLVFMDKPKKQCSSFFFFEFYRCVQPVLIRERGKKRRWYNLPLTTTTKNERSTIESTHTHTHVRLYSYVVAIFTTTAKAAGVAAPELCARLSHLPNNPARHYFFKTLQWACTDSGW